MFKVGDTIEFDKKIYRIIGFDPTDRTIHAMDLQPAWKYLLRREDGEFRRVKSLEGARLLDPVVN